MVGRPRQFDESDVLDRAMQSFWAHGYESTSMADLVEATGLHKGSIYQAFGNKHQLFIAALKAYLDGMLAQKNEALKAADSPLDGIRSVLHTMLEIADDDAACPRGCMALNALVELNPHDPEVRQLLESFMTRTRESMVEVVRQAQDAGQVSRSRPAELITMMMMTFMSGLAAQLKGPLTKPEAHQLLDAQLEMVT